jgi:hypothetical protein
MNNSTKKRKAEIVSETINSSSSKKSKDIKTPNHESPVTSQALENITSKSASDKSNVISLSNEKECKDSKLSYKMDSKFSLTPVDKVFEEKKSETAKKNQGPPHRSNPKFRQAKLEFFNIKVESKTPALSLENLEKGRIIKIYSWNVNGIRATIDKGYFDNFIKQENPDILCLNETKINQETLEKQKIDKIYKETYASYWNCSEEKNGYSGVCIFTKFKPIKVKNGMGIEKHDGEGKSIVY